MLVPLGQRALAAEGLALAQGVPFLAASAGPAGIHRRALPAPSREQEARIEVQGGVGGPTWQHAPFVDLHVASTNSFVTYTLVKVRPSY